MHFPEVSGGTYQKFSSPKLGELDQFDVGGCWLNREKLTLNFWAENF